MSNRAHRRSSGKGSTPFVFLARVRRTSFPGMPDRVSLDLIRDEDPVEIADGDAFVTVQMQVDPFREGS